MAVFLLGRVAVGRTSGATGALLPLTKKSEFNQKNKQTWHVRLRKAY
jgi:hypothetical protein